MGLKAAWGGFFTALHHDRKKDARTIAHHYDVSNDFYALWLDLAMAYSCAYFASASEGLEAAQQAKLDHVLTKIMLQPGDRLLDIGCGWGALAMRAAQKHGAKVVGVTLSKNQYELARLRVAQAGLADRVDIRLQDYRDLGPQDGRFDKITSIGMFEPWGSSTCRNTLAPTMPFSKTAAWRSTTALPPPNLAAAPRLWGRRNS